jgi:hypothetical protein
MIKQTLSKEDQAKGKHDFCKTITHEELRNKLLVLQS